MNNVFRDDYFIDVTGDKPTLYKADSEDISFSFGFAIVCAILDFIIGSIILAYHAINTGLNTAIGVIVAWIIINLMGLFVFNENKREHLSFVDIGKSCEIDIINKPDNVTAEEWDNFIATLMIDNNANEYGKIWMNKKERKAINNFVYNNIEISNQISYEKEQEDNKLKQIAYSKKKVENISKYNNAASEFIEKNITSNVQ